MMAIDWAAFYIPHPAKAEKGGEDAYFFVEDGNLFVRSGF